MLRRFLQDYFRHVSGIWKKNWPGFIRRHRVLLALLSLASLADCASTIHFMVHDTGLEETHPIVREICRWLGPVLGPIVGKLAQLISVIAVAAFLRPWAAYILGTVTALYFYAAWYNIWGYKLYTPLFLRVLEPLTRF